MALKSTKSSTPKPADPGLKVVLRNLGVYNLYRQIMLLFWATAGVAAFAIALAVFFFLQKTPPGYVQASMDGKIIQSIPLDKPNMDPPAVFQFVRQAIGTLNRYDYINYRAQIPEAQQYFTPRGWSNYVQQLKDRGTIRAVEVGKDVVTVQFTGPATLVKAAPLKISPTETQYVWVVDQPVKVDYIANSNTAATASLTQTGKVRIYLVRMPYTEFPSGVAIQIYNFMETDPSGNPPSN